MTDEGGVMDDGREAPRTRRRKTDQNPVSFRHPSAFGQPATTGMARSRPMPHSRPTPKPAGAGWWLAVLAVLVIGLACGLPYAVPLPGGELNDPAAYARAGEQMLTVDGTRTVVLDQGPRDGRPVVLIHGFGGSTFSWRDTVPALTAAGYRVVALDLRGFGLSDKDFEADYSHAAQADFVAALMDNLGLERAVIVGHSMGGSVSLHLAERHPERVQGLVLVAAAARWGQTDGGGSVLGLPTDLGQVATFGPLRWWARLGLRLYFTPERLASVQRSAYVVTDVITPEVERGYGQVIELHDWDSALLGVVRDAGRNALPLAPDTVRAPTRLIWGERDPWIGLDRGRALQAAMPGSTLTVIPAIGHLPMEEAPADFNAALLADLAEIDDR